MAVSTAGSGNDTPGFKEQIPRVFCWVVIDADLAASELINDGHPYTFNRPLIFPARFLEVIDDPGTKPQDDMETYSSGQVLFFRHQTISTVALSTRAPYQMIIAERLDFLDDRSYIHGMARPRKSDQTRERLLDQGVTMLVEQGYHGTGIKEVLDAVKVPKGSFYNYFESKEHFGAEVVRHYGQGLHRQMDKAPGRRSGSAYAALKRHFKELIRGYERSGKRVGCLVGNLGAELGETSEPCRVAMAETLQGTEDRLRELIIRAQEQRDVRTDIAAKDLAGMLLNAWEGALIRMKVEASMAPAKQFVTLMVGRFLQA